MEQEYTLEEFKKVAKVGKTNKANGYLSGSRLISAIAVRWKSKFGKHEVHFDNHGKDYDYVTDCFKELQEKCIIRDCLTKI